MTTSPATALEAAWRNVIALGADDGRLVTTAFEEPRSAVSVPLPSDLPPVLADGLRARGATVTIPTAHLRQGEQLAFYARAM